MADDTLPKTDKAWQAYLQNVKAPAERKRLSLGGALRICLETGGRKTFQARIRRVGDKNPRTIDIGSFPAVSVADARKRIDAARSVAKEGGDPALDRRRAKAGVEDVRTFGQLVDLYLSRRESDSGRAASTLLGERRRLGVARKALGDRLLSTLTPRDVSAFVESEMARLRKRGGSARNASLILGDLKQVRKRALGWGYEIPDFASTLSRPVATQARERVLYDGAVLCNRLDPELNELGSMIAGLRSHDAPIGGDRETRAALMLCLNLGLRAGEAAALEWGHVRLDDTVPHIIIAKSKTRSGERTLPLPGPIVDMLRGLKAQAGARAQYVFPAREDASRLLTFTPRACRAPSSAP